jgi:hypothetical protein
MRVLDIIKEEIVLFHEDDYRGDHTAPVPEGNNRMDDLSDIYGEDFYGHDAVRMYGHYRDNRDNQAISVIQSAKGKPNQKIKIYRAVPDTNYDINAKLKPLLDIYNYYQQWNMFPMKNQIVYDLQDKYSIEDHSYDEQQKLILNDISNQIDGLQAQTQKNLGINSGDWVTIDRNYAKEHGEANLGGRYKIVSKTVPAKTLYTDGNDIFEWGYVV